MFVYFHHDLKGDWKWFQMFRQFTPIQTLYWSAILFIIPKINLKKVCKLNSSLNETSIHNFRLHCKRLFFFSLIFLLNLDNSISVLCIHLHTLVYGVWLERLKYKSVSSMTKCIHKINLKLFYQSQYHSRHSNIRFEWLIEKFN